MSRLSDLLESRDLLRYFRDQMANRPRASWLSEGIVKLNEQIDATTTAIDDEIKQSRATMKDLFLLLDYPTWSRPK